MGSAGRSFRDLLNAGNPDEGVFLFRALTVDGRRRAIRLERGFWQSIEEIARSEDIKLGELISAIDGSSLHGNNLASAIRQFVLFWLTAKLEQAREKMEPPRVGTLVNACPTPAFALNSQRRLRYFNPAFLRFVHLNMPVSKNEDVGRNLRLQLDMTMEDLFRTLEEKPHAPLAVGFVIGMNERRLRGQIHVVAAPCWNEDMVIGYIAS